jgi:hypothetical protein
MARSAPSVAALRLVVRMNSTLLLLRLSTLPARAVVAKARERAKMDVRRQFIGKPSTQAKLLDRSIV